MKRNKVRRLITYTALCLSCLAYGQDWKRASIWYFGYNAGLNFNTNPPTPLTDGMVNTIEGCASICDKFGNLLLYTDGQSVWNKNHHIISNGSGLKGTPSTSQNSIFIPVMEGDSMVLLFTLDGGGAGIGMGLNYNLINTNSDTGKGEIILKNQQLITGLTEKMAVTMHDNGMDYWLIVHGANDNIFYTYLVKEDGSITCPLENKIGKIYNNSFTKGGTMKFNPTGSNLVVSNWYEGIELFDFNQKSGRLSSAQGISGVNFVYGLEFSPSGQYLYALERNNRLLQIETNNLDSIHTVFSNTTVADIQGMQGTSTKEIFISTNSKQNLHSIRYPDKKGDSCFFDTLAIYLGGKVCSYGLPSFIGTFISTNRKTIKYELTCSSKTANFYGSSDTVVSSWNWTFKDRDSFEIGTANSQNTVFYFPDTGAYYVRLIADSDTLYKTIFIESNLDLGRDTLLCGPSQLVLSIPANFRCLQWQDGSDTNNYRIIQSGKYYLSAYNIQGCRLSDTVEVQFINLPKPLITRSNDTLFTDSGYTYKWYLNGNLVSGNQRLLKVLANGTYKVEISDSNACTSFSDNILVTGLAVQSIQNHSFKVYPNPANELEGISIVGEALINTVEVYDLLGKRIYHKNAVNSQKHTINRLHGGVYILKINESITFKIMIK